MFYKSVIYSELFGGKHIQATLYDKDNNFLADCVVKFEEFNNYLWLPNDIFSNTSTKTISIDASSMPQIIELRFDYNEFEVIMKISLDGNFNFSIGDYVAPKLEVTFNVFDANILKI